MTTRTGARCWSSRTAGPSAARPTARVGETFGEAVFSTGMTGYQETLTDPSYHRQVVVMTAPHIGNTGVNDEDPESRRIWVAGYVVRDPARRRRQLAVASARLDDELAAQGVVGISGIDTRALTRHLRERGAMRVGISSTETDAERAARAGAGGAADGRRRPGRRGHAPPSRTSCRRVGEQRFTVAALDLGIKAMTPRADGRARHRGARAAGDGDARRRARGRAPTASSSPTARATRRPPTTRSRCCAACSTRGIPFFGICFGNQILGRALGFGTYKLRYGHRGINQPVHGPRHRQGRDHRAQPRLRRRRAARRADRHAVRPGRGQPRLPQRRRRRGAAAACDVPAFSVQYHPEAAAGPHDAGLPVRPVRRPDGTPSRRRLMPRRDDIAVGPGHRLRADRDRPGLRVRLLRHPGLPGAARPRACGSSWSTPTRPRS